MNTEESMDMLAPSAATSAPPLPGPPPLPEADPIASRHAEIWAELDKRQSRKASAWNGVMILILTLSLSVGIGSQQWTFEKALIVMGILFVHELGHLATMRCFGYRELRMLFVPFLGAAVTGKNYNVSGWKKALVSLMGPLPGIFIGAVLGIFSVASHNHWLAELSLLAIAINGMNLLPIPPLDGGWFWTSVIFCRHHSLEVAFKLGTAVIGIVATLAGFGAIWMILGVVTLLTLPLTLMQGRIATYLRQQGVAADSGDGQTIPRGVGDQIFDALLGSLKTKLSPAAMAENGLQVYERLNATPPRIMESIGLSLLYVLSLVVALIGFFAAGIVHFEKELHEDPQTPAVEHVAPANK